MQAQEVITDITTILNDLGKVTYPETSIISAINDAQRVIGSARPDAISSTQSLALVSGSKQTIPSSARRLLDVVRNMGADGSTPGQAIRSTITAKDISNINPFWHTTVGQEVIEYIFDEARPNEFYVFPNVATPHYVEIKTADRPTTVSAATDVISVDEIYAPCLVSWSIYRLLSRDGDSSPNIARAQEHKNVVYDLLQIKTAAEQIISPNFELNDRRRS